MALSFETFSNVRGGSSLFKALGHPLAAERARALLARLGAGSLAVYDPQGLFPAFAELYDAAGLDLRAGYVQRVEDVGRRWQGHEARPITALTTDPSPQALLVAVFDAERTLAHVRHLIPAGTEVVSFDALRLPDTMLTNPRRYLDPLNFATNFAFLRDAGGLHTRITLCNYWSGYGAPDPRIWLQLFAADGTVLARWEEPLGAPGSTLEIDSQAVRRRFGLGDFTGSLFIHALGIAGHDVVKYALDTYGDRDTELSCTHDANAWPADFYAGLPAPDAGEVVTLWIQNSHPREIPARGVGVSEMGSDEVRWLERPIPPFATHLLDVGRLLPESRWPTQLEVHAGKYFVRPRYEIVTPGTGRRRMAHANVERTDLRPDPGLPAAARWLGKGYLLPAPLLPPAQWSTEVLPTPMARSQQELPLAVMVYDASGDRVLRHSLGVLPRAGCTPVPLDRLFEESAAALPGGYGHLELVYDFDAGDAADGWLHAIFRYRQRTGEHAAESSFGAHMYNVPLTYGNEPQSYAGPAPGLSTRLFLRLGPEPMDTLCHLIYPSSVSWHPHSATRLTLHDACGGEVASREVRIPCSGSLLWRYREMFDTDERARAGRGAYVIVRDTTCRLFGYHGLLNGDAAFSLDHMFGF